jgi:hypothetical protein
VTEVFSSPKKKRKSGIPTGNAGEYFVMGELLRRGFDAQLADRNTRGYDILTGLEEDVALKKIQVKTVRAQPWYVKLASFEGNRLDEFTIYVLLGDTRARSAVRFFITQNRDVAHQLQRQANWRDNGFMSLTAVSQFEDRWDKLLGTRELNT